MGSGFKKIFFVAVILLLAKLNSYGQFTVTSANACPNQTVTLSASWNNVGSITYTISRVGFPITVQTSPNFVVSDAGPGPTTVVYSFTAQGTALSGPVTATASATLTIIAPPPLTLTQPNGGFYCHNATAAISAPIGSVFNYSVTGPLGTPNFPPSPSNVINIPNLVSPVYTGQYTVTANIAGCVRTGITLVNVSPNHSITVTPATNICQGGNVNLTASLPPAANTPTFFWTRPNNNSVNGPVLSIAVAQYSDNGVYNVYASYLFNTITCQTTGTTAVTVVQTSTIDISASPSKTLCQGANVNLNAVTTVTAGYSWVGPFYTSSQRSPTITNLAQINSGVYTVTALFYNNALTCPVTKTINISIIQTSDPNPIAVPNVCQDSPSTLSVTIGNPSIPPPVYAWSGQNGYVFGPTANTVALISQSMQPIQSGPYYVTATYGNASTTLCAITRSVVINVVPVNTINVIPPSDVCQPNNAFLQASAIGATSFTWAGPNGNVGSTANVTLYHPLTSATGIYTITMGFGGAALTCYNTNTVSLTVKPLLPFTLTPLINNNYCVGDTLAISGPPGATSYSWTSSTGFTANSQNIKLFPLSSFDSGDYFLTVSLNGCITTGTTSMKVRSRIEFSQPIPDQTICRGDSIHLEAHVTGGPNAVDDPSNTQYLSCTWNPPIYLNTPNELKTSGVPLGTTIYNPVIHDPSCPNYSLSASVKITVNQPPTPHLDLERTESCEPLCMFYDTQTHGTSTLVTYDFGGNKKFQLDSSFICLEAPGVYDLKIHLYGINGCTVSYTYPSQLIVNPKPHSEISVSPEFPTITDDVTFDAVTKYPVASYNWQLSNSFLVPDTFAVQSFNKIYETSGKYLVLLTATTEKGCSDTVAKYIDIRDDFNVFIPNTFTPNNDNVNDMFQVKSTGLRSEAFSMELINRWGKQVYFTKDPDAGWDGTIGGQKAPIDVYIYKIRVIGANGEGRKEYVGRFSLIR